ncbi:flocculation-associated PEP-CTERM protein PepA [Nitrosovibrio tenuis]|uniref:PEP-CTERM protein-sorting domain-containing protein n=1 Tax=Nitrosovibrio tenuis TaxID=1233 RepID=A0A1H7RRC2_9PROT|nr:flocculation-associated PEP-CTERM protein PepA [Nitrosovibrio tenuis]SEL62578.1 PEP-CTERM protein-sorting domain-containing protein [Nitrosovibrio tenuis]
MKILRVQIKLQTVATVAILALGISSQASAFPTFTVDPNAAFGPGHGTGPFQADFIIGTSSTHVDTPGALIEHGQGWVNFTTFVNGGSAVLGSVSGLNNNWQMWAEFKFDLSLTSGTYGQLGSTYTVTSLHADFWVDPSIGTPTAFVSANNLGELATVTHGADSFRIATADLIAGVADLNLQGGTAFNSVSSFNLLNPAGNSLFTAPVPFYNRLFNEFNNTSQGVFRDPAGNFIAINQTSGGIDFNAVTTIPEPETYAMFLAGLGLLGWRMREARS